MSTTLEALMAQIDALVTEAVFLHQWTAKGVPSASSAKAYQASHAALQSALSEAVALTRCACGDSFTKADPGKCVNCRAADGEALDAPMDGGCGRCSGPIPCVRTGNNCALADKEQQAEPVDIGQFCCGYARIEAGEYKLAGMRTTPVMADGQAHPIYAFPDDVPERVYQALMAPPVAPAAPVAPTDDVVSYVARWGGNCRDCADENGVCPNSGLPCGGYQKAIQHVIKALQYGVQHGYISNPLDALPAPAAPVAPQVVRPMTNERASYFMERFLHEEKLLGPNEQAALHYVIAMLAATSAPAAAPAEGARWLPIESAPKDGRKIIVSYVNCNGKTRTVMARWLTDEQAAETDADGVGLEGGWYECIDNWDDYTEVAIHEGDPTHWMPIPAAPTEAPNDQA